MPPKGKKAAQKSRAAKAPAPTKQAEPLQLVPEEDAAVEEKSGSSSLVFGSAEGSAKRRRLNRRDTAEQVERVVQRRLLPQFRLEAINGVVNEAGEHIRPYIARHIRESRGGGRKQLTSKFWSEFFKAFDLHGKRSDALPPIWRGCE